ncbi:ABC transporter ATP-binding protein [Trinickia symbiotica]|uniref:ABC transporter ATP-binding protein n=1 Tax=Trinickia symbiotica TaxID=863227 RepID=A0A2T3XQL4_9BURK|nr:ABC transporter ATP-binding protein [Trinickia symbiotica]PTB18820.1 ABC transporter ATP-binding protein [Trinickia symbiotica]
MADLILRGVGKRYPDALAVDGLDLAIPAGAFVALLGPSGCGKTTTLRMLAGFENVDAGQIVLGNQVLSSPDTHVPPEHRRMGMVFQSYALWPHMSVAQNVGYALKLRGVRAAEYERRVREALESVHLAEYADAAPQALSGGQRQRVALARCLASEARVVLLDEPLANLDRHLRASMEQAFREFHRRTGATFVYVTHDQAEAMALADRVAVMHRGRLVQWATPEELYQRPRTEWLARFIGNGSVLEVVGQPLGPIDGQLLMNALGCAEGQRVPVLVRPQHVQLDESGVVGEVRDCVFRGERYEVLIALPDHQQLLTYHNCHVAIGQRVTARISQAWGLERG